VGAAVEAFGEAFERLLVLVVAAHVLQRFGEPVERPLIDVGDAGGGDRIPGPGPDVVIAQVGAGNADDRPAVEDAPGREVVERREELLVGQIAGGAEQHQGIGPGPGARGQLLGALSVAHECTAWPPNCWRSAAITFMAGDSSCREAKRAKRAAEIAGAGTARRTASCTVQRPSPESSAQPLSSASSGSSSRARSRR